VKWALVTKQEHSIENRIDIILSKTALMNGMQGKPWRRLWHLIGGSFFPILALFVPKGILLVTLGAMTAVFAAWEIVRFRCSMVIVLCPKSISSTFKASASLMRHPSRKSSLMSSLSRKHAAAFSSSPTSLVSKYAFIALCKHVWHAIHSIVCHLYLFVKRSLQAQGMVGLYLC